MKPFKKIQGKLANIKLSVVLTTIALLAVFIGGVKILQADGGNNMFGYMWSSNIGWMQMNDCSNPADSTTCAPAASYGVTVLPTAPGTMSGYAWSSNIGWITFNNVGCPATVAGCTGGASATWKADGSATIKGWARACSVYASGCSGALKDNAYLGTWDGFIALDSASAGGSGGTWGLTIGTDDKLGGYAWGSQVIGWIDNFNASVYIGGPTAMLTAKPATINEGDKSILTVTASNIDGASACTIVGQAGLVMAQGSNGTWTGSIPVTPSLTTLYTVNCTKGTQKATAQATVTVNFFIPPTPPGCTGSGCTPPTCSGTNCTLPTGGNGSGGTSGGYCANTNPQFAWNSDATECTITDSAGDVEHVAGNSADMATVTGAVLTQINGVSYYTTTLPVSSQSSTYVLQCKNGSAPVVLKTAVNQCSNDFTIVPSLPTGTKSTSKTSIAQDLKLSTDGSTYSATFNITVNPIGGFAQPVDLSLGTIPSNAPSSLSAGASFSVTELTATSGKYGTAQVTFTIPATDVKQGDIYKDITILGFGDGLSRSGKITLTVGATSNSNPPIFNEF